VSILVSLITYSIVFYRQTDKFNINLMFSSQSLAHNEIWNHPAYGLNLVVFCILNYPITILCMTTSIPAGVPYCIFGAAFGRLFGLFIQSLFPSLVVDESIYAVIGAAAFISSITKTISVAIIVFEMTS
jgi:H+/Cl- antiporter ClcA